MAGVLAAAISNKLILNKIGKRPSASEVVRRMTDEIEEQGSPYYAGEPDFKGIDEGFHVGVLLG